MSLNNLFNDVQLSSLFALSADNVEHISTSFMYLVLSSIAIVSAIMVIGASNPIHSVLFLVLVFISSAGLLLLLGAELLAMLFIIVYVGAIAILFLFVVMMLPTHGKHLYDVSTYIPIALLLIGGLSFSFLAKLSANALLSPVAAGDNTSVLDKVEWREVAAFNEHTSHGLSSHSLYTNNLEGLTNTEVLGRLLFTEFSSFFLISGLILLVAMIGAIVLTMHRRGDVKRQEIYQQIARDFKTTVVLVQAEKSENV
jgi:NADH-quinone oxidoreductase subunit J